MTIFKMFVFFLLPINFFLLASHFVPSKRTIKTVPAVAVIFLSTSIYLLIRSVVISIDNHSLLSVLLRLLLLGVYAAVLLQFFYENKLSKRHFYLVYIGGTLIVELILWFFATKSFHFTIAASSQMTNLRYEFSNYLLFLIFLYLKLMEKEKQEQNLNPAILLQLLLIVACLVSILIFFSISDSFILIGLLVMAFFFYHYFNYANHLYQSVHRSQLIHQNYLLMDEHYERLNAYHQEVQLLNKEMKGQLEELQMFMHKEELSQAEGHLQSMIEEYVLTENPRVTEHKAMNILLAHKYHQARTKNIDCHFEIKLTPDIRIADNDLVSLIGNLLDNAIEACCYCSSEERWMSFKMILHQHCLVIQSENSIDSVHRSLQTRKKEKWKHGLGMKSIYRVVKEYNGAVEHCWKQQSFFIELNLWENHS